MTSWHSTAVSCRAMRTGRRRHGAPQSALRHWRSTKFPSVQYDKLWPTSIFVRRPSCLELTARIFATNHFNWTLQALSKNVFIRVDIALSALEAFLLNGLYRFTYLLTYLHYLLTLCQVHAGEEDHARHRWTTSILGQDSPWNRMTEDIYKWRKCVHGVANPRIDDG